MTRTALLVALLFATSLIGGCLGGEEGDDPSTPGGPSEVAFTVTAPESAIQNQTFTVNWSFTSDDAGPAATADANVTGNGTSGNVSADAGGFGPTGIAWGYSRVSEPTNISDYENTTGEVPAGAPGTEYSAEIEPNDLGTIYLRAYVEVDGEYAFSSEQEVIIGALDPAIVEIDAGFLGGPAASYEPADITIAVGDYVVWTNTDTFAHTATSRDGPGSFDTGDIAPNTDSDPIQFLTAGTYTYGCDNHPSMAEATLTVEEAPGG